MRGPEITAALREGRARGAEHLWIGGGEPTLRRDLFAIVRAARSLGYRRIKLQTNAMMLAYPAFTERCRDAGVTEINVSIKGATEASHDARSATPGSFALLVKGVEEARRALLDVEADVLVYRTSAHEIPAIVGLFTPLGVARYSFWLLSVAGSGTDAPEVIAEVPRIADVIPYLREAAALGLSDRPDFITSLHTPPCTVPDALRACLFDAKALDLWVTNPGGRAFPLSSSPIEGGLYFEGCSDCPDRGRCSGARADYVAIYGDSEFRPRT